MQDRSGFRKQSWYERYIGNNGICHNHDAMYRLAADCTKLKVANLVDVESLDEVREPDLL